MFIILKGEYKSRIQDQIYIENIITNEIKKVSSPYNINNTMLINFLHYGTTLKKSITMPIEERLIIQIFKLNSELFLITEDHREINKEQNIRYALEIAKNSGTSVEKLKSYRKSFNDMVLTIWCNNEDGLIHTLNNAGFATNINTSFKKEESQEIVIMDKDYEVNLVGLQNATYLLYSVKTMQIGPVLFSEHSDSIACALQHLEATKEQEIFTNTHAQFIHNFIINTIIFLIGDLYEELYVDSGLPLGKSFLFKRPNLQVVAKAFYKGVIKL